MVDRCERSHRAALLIVMAALALAMPSRIQAQRGQGPPAVPEAPRAAAAVDLTGMWVSVISEDWVLRMAVPQNGNYTRIPLTPAARTAADAWDPARDEAAGQQCKAYGAPIVTRQPGRMRISWQDDNTLKAELEAGNQTRLLQFRPAEPPSEPSWQGRSIAEWRYPRVPPRIGSLKVVTDRLRPGYLRRNGVPYSANTTMTEYYHRMNAPNGDVWLTIVTEVRDPENLREPFVQSTHFKKLPDDAEFGPRTLLGAVTPTRAALVSMAVHRPRGGGGATTVSCPCRQAFSPISS